MMLAIPVFMLAVCALFPVGVSHCVAPHTVGQRQKRIKIHGAASLQLYISYYYESHAVLEELFTFLKSIFKVSFTQVKVSYKIIKCSNTSKRPALDVGLQKI